jgi:hypothetical protein
MPVKERCIGALLKQALPTVRRQQWVDSDERIKTKTADGTHAHEARAR